MADLRSQFGPLGAAGDVAFGQAWALAQTGGVSPWVRVGVFWLSLLATIVLLKLTLSGDCSEVRCAV